MEAEAAVEKVKPTAGSASASATPLELPKSIPTVSNDALAGACRRSARARRLDATLRAREEDGRPLGDRDVDKMVRAATRPNGTVDGDQAAVIAHHARRCPGLFAGGHRALIRFLERVAWRALLADLEEFIIRVREQEADARKREELKRSIEDDRLEQDERRVERNKATAAAETRKVDDARGPTLPPKDERLDADSRLRRTLERMKRA